MNIEEIIGTWKSKNFPTFNYNDNITVTLYIHHSHKATLWILDADKKSKTLSEGLLNINKIEDDKFEFLIDGEAIDEKFLTIQTRLYILKEPKSFILDIPEFGERYFEKIN